MISRKMSWSKAWLVPGWAVSWCEPQAVTQLCRSGRRKGTVSHSWGVRRGLPVVHCFKDSVKPHIWGQVIPDSWVNLSKRGLLTSPSHLTPSTLLPHAPHFPPSFTLGACHILLSWLNALPWQKPSHFLWSSAGLVNWFVVQWGLASTRDNKRQVTQVGVGLPLVVSVTQLWMPVILLENLQATLSSCSLSLRSARYSWPPPSIGTYLLGYGCFFGWATFLTSSLRHQSWHKRSGGKQMEMWQMWDYPFPQQWPVLLAKPILSHHTDVKGRMESTILLPQILTTASSLGLQRFWENVRQPPYQQSAV